MDTKFIAGALIVVAVAGGTGFWGGMTYAKSQTPARGAGQFGAGNFAGRVGGAGARTANNAAFGTIIAKDTNSITVQLGGPNATSTPSTGSTGSPQAGSGQGTGSMVVLYNASTEVGKTATGSSSDLTVGENVTVSGTANSDGSITAHSIQIRPAGMGRPGGATPTNGQ